MSSVWYLGKSDKMVITVADWAARGITAASDSVWDKTNGWSIPTTSFTTQQLTLLAAEGARFNAAAPDGPRPGAAVGAAEEIPIKPSDLVTRGLDARSQWPEKFLRDFSLDTKRLRIDATDFGSVNSNLGSGHADVLAVAGANGEFFQMPSAIDAPIPSTCPVDFGGATQRVWLTNYSATTRPMNFMVNTWRLMHDGDHIVLFSGGPNAGQIFVDGTLVAESDTMFVGNTWTSIKFPTRKTRLIEIRTDASFNTIYWKKNYRVWKPKPVDGPRLLAVGDSLFAPFIYTDGVNQADKPHKGWWQQISPYLGIRDLLIDGVGSTGFIKESTVGATNNFNQRFELCHKPYNPDILCIAGGTNDVYNGNTDTDIISAMKTYFTNARAAWPDAKLVMVGGIKPGNGWPADALTRYSNIATALLADTSMQKAGLYIIDTWTTPWIFGTGRDTAVAGNGNSDFYTGSDGIHLNVSGNRYMAGRTAERLRKILRDRGQLINTII